MVHQTYNSSSDSTFFSAEIAHKPYDLSTPLHSLSNSFKTDFFVPKLTLTEEVAVEQLPSFLRRPEEPILYTNDWTVAIVFASLILLTLLKTFLGKYMRQFFEAAFNQKLMAEIIGLNVAHFQNIGLGLSVVFTLNFSLFLYFIFNLYLPENTLFSSVSGYFLLLFLVTGIYIIKYGVLRMLGILMNNVYPFQVYVHNVQIFNRLFAIGLLPFLLIIPFNEGIVRTIGLWVPIVIFSFFYVFRLIRGIQIILRKDVSIFYLILYLCTLEILPLLFIYKIAVQA